MHDGPERAVVELTTAISLTDTRRQRREFPPTSVGASYSVRAGMWPTNSLDYSATDYEGTPKVYR